MSITRAEFYEELVICLTPEDFKTLYGVEPLDIWSFDYSFDRVKWNQEMEFSYNVYCQEVGV